MHVQAKDPTPSETVSARALAASGDDERFVRRCPEHHADLRVDTRALRSLPCPRGHKTLWWEVWDRTRQAVVALGGALECAFLGFVGEPPVAHPDVARRGPSPNLWWSELACRDGVEYPAAWRRDRAVLLALEFEVLRWMCGNRPLRVLSGYRTPAHNIRVGGARDSQHLAGRALDLAPPSGMSIDEFARVVRSRTKHLDSQIRGLGVYPRFIHIDIRDADRLVAWQGQRSAADIAEAA
jgi:hypothetical protein